MALHICPTCGNDEMDRDDGGVYRCPICDQPAEPVIAKMRADVTRAVLISERDRARDRCVWLDGKVAEAIRHLEHAGESPDAHTATISVVLRLLKAVE